jgi:hypothetical protein
MGLFLVRLALELLYCREAASEQLFAQLIDSPAYMLE